MGIWFPGGYPGGGGRRGGGNYPNGGGNYPNQNGRNYPNTNGRNYPNGNGGNYPNGNGGNYPNGNSGGNYPNSNGRNNPNNNRNSGGSIFDVLGAILNGGGVFGGGGYPGGGRNRGGGAGTTRAEYELADQYLHDLARVSGARLYDSEQTNLNVAFQSVAEELRRQYSIGYYPKNRPSAGERRNIRVKVDRPELVVRTRDSYVFQPGSSQSAQGNTQQPASKPPVLKKDYTGTQWH
jgi:hypothetical protein